MVDVKGHICFPTLIHEFDLDIPINDKIQMLSYIKSSKVKSHGMRQTEDDINKISYFKYFKNNIIEVSKIILEECKYEYEDIIITNMWGNLLNPGQNHPPHTHSNNFLSGVFYLQSDIHSSPIQFFDPRPQTSILTPPIKENNIQKQIIVEYTVTYYYVIYYVMLCYVMLWSVMVCVVNN